MLQIILRTILYTVIAYILLFLMIRALGRKALSEMTLFDFILAITLGSLTAHICLMGDNSPSATITALVTFAILGIITDFIHINSIRFRKFVNSEPIVLIHNGQIVKANMVKARITLTELTSMLRGKSVFNISDVNYAIMENTGDLSVLLKADKSPLTPADMKQNPVEKGLTKDIIIDGKLMRENLQCSGMTEQELMKQLNNRGIRKVDEVFYAGVDSSGKLYVSKGQDGQEQAGKYGIE